MNTRVLTFTLLACGAQNALADGARHWLDVGGYSVAIAAGGERYSIGMPDGSDRKDNAYLNDPMDNMVGFLVRRARHGAKERENLSHRNRYETTETVYKLGLNQDRVMVKAKYRF